MIVLYVVQLSSSLKICSLSSTLMHLFAVGRRDSSLAMLLLPTFEISVTTFTNPTPMYDPTLTRKNGQF